MIPALRHWLKRQQFHPGLLGVLVNPFWLTRRGLLTEVARHAPALGDGRVLDFGCGAKPYRELFTASEYIGVDLETSGHDHADEAIDVFYDGRTLPFADGHFDGVFATEVLEHVFEPERILSELHRVLRPGGRLLLTIPFAWGEHEEPYDFARYTSFGLRALLERNGFHILTMEKTGNSAQVIAQLAAAALRDRMPSSYRMQSLLLPCTTAPLLIAGLLLGWLTGARQRLYLNTIVLAERQPTQ